MPKHPFILYYLALQVFKGMCDDMECVMTSLIQSDNHRKHEHGINHNKHFQASCLNIHYTSWHSQAACMLSYFWYIKIGFKWRVICSVKIWQHFSSKKIMFCDSHLRLAGYFLFTSKLCSRVFSLVVYLMQYIWCQILLEITYCNTSNGLIDTVIFICGAKGIFDWGLCLWTHANSEGYALCYFFIAELKPSSEMDMSDVHENLKSLYEYNVMLREKLMATQSLLHVLTTKSSSPVTENKT